LFPLLLLHEHVGARFVQGRFRGATSIVVTNPRSNARLNDIEILPQAFFLGSGNL